MFRTVAPIQFSLIFETRHGALLDKYGRAMQITGSFVDILPPTQLAGVLLVQPRLCPSIRLTEFMGTWPDRRGRQCGYERC
jgi:hypothetical protein